jgi:hypothetical protein
LIHRQQLPQRMTTSLLKNLLVFGAAMPRCSKCIQPFSYLFISFIGFSHLGGRLWKACAHSNRYRFTMTGKNGFQSHWSCAFFLWSTTSEHLKHPPSVCMQNLSFFCECLKFVSFLPILPSVYPHIFNCLILTSYFIHRYFFVSRDISLYTV